MMGWEIEERINQGYYQPERRQFNVSETDEFEEIQKFKIRISQLEKKVEDKKKAFQREQQHLAAERLEEFKQDCFGATELKGHPKREEAWNKAWDRGHGNGLYDVYLVLLDLADLLT